MSFAGFLAKYSDEALAIGKALTTVMEGLALSPAQAAKVNETISKLETASSNIQEVLATAPEKTVIKIAQSDVDAAVARVLPDMVAKAVADALAAKDNANG